jgi:glycosyltransferase involved in cell wall biosynthesis
MLFSLIIPVYNRPDEVDELLESLSQSTYNDIFEIVLIEDGSTLASKDVASKYGDRLDYFKENSGPGDSRNYGKKPEVTILSSLIQIVLFQKSIYQQLMQL